jgi:hypothetical protein
MANLKISQLTAVTNNTIGSWVIVNNSGETTTNKTQLSNLLGLTNGSGTGSIKSADFLTPTGSTAETNFSISLGNGASASTADNQIVIGNGAYGRSVGFIGIGYGAHDQGTGRDYGIAIGWNAEAYQSGAIVIGKDAGAVTNAFAIGTTARAIGTDTIAIGNTSVVAGNLGIGIGGGVFQDKQYGTAIGYATYCDGERAVAIGYDNTIGGDIASDASIAIGNINAISGGNNQIVIGNQISSQSPGTIAISNENVDLGTNSEGTIFMISTGHTVNTRVGANGVYIGGFSQTISNPGKGSYLYGGSGNTISSTGDNAGMFHSIGSTNPGNVRLAGIYNSRNSQISGSTANGVWGGAILGSNEGKILDGNWHALIGGSSNELQNVRNCQIVGGSQNIVRNNGQNCQIIGGSQNIIDNGNDINNIENAIFIADRSKIEGADLSAIFGGNENGISGGSLNYIVGGTLNQIKNSPFNNDIIGSDACTIDQGDLSSIINSKSCSIGNQERVTIIGSSGSTTTTGTDMVLLGLLGRTPNTSNTSYVENLRSYGQIYNGYYDNGSGTNFTIDWNLGNSQKITMTGNTTLTFTNVRSGAQYRLMIDNDGTYDITGATASGFTILCEGAALPNITNNGVDLCVLEVMGTDILVRHFANFATP